MERREVGKYLRELRGKERVSDIAKELGVTESAYRMYEQGNRTPNDSMKKLIARHFNKTVGEIFFGE